MGEKTPTKQQNNQLFKNVIFLVNNFLLVLCSFEHPTALLLTCHRVKRVPDKTGLLPHEPCRLITEEASTKPWKQRSYYPYMCSLFELFTFDFLY